MRVQRSTDVVFRELESDGGGVLLRLDSGAYHGLNEMGCLIWSMVGEGASVDELVSGVEQRVEAAPTELRRDVEAFVSDLVERGLLVPIDQP